MSSSASSTVYINEYESGLKILRDSAFGVDHPFRATRQLFGPNVLDTEGDKHIPRKKAWLAQFSGKSIASDHVQGIVKSAVERGFALGKEQGDLMVAAVFIPNRVVLDLLGCPQIDAFDHPDRMRPITEYLETNVKTPEAMAAKAYLREGPFGAAPDVFAALPQEDREKELMLLAYAAAETTMVALKCTLMFWATRNRAFHNALEANGMDGFILQHLKTDPPLGLATRYCKRDTQVDGQTFVKGDIIHVNIVSGNTGCPVHPRSGHPIDLTFGTGKHSCPGHLLAKAEMQTVIEHLMTLDIRDYEVVQPATDSRPANFRHPDLRILTPRQSAVSE